MLGFQSVLKSIMDTNQIAFLKHKSQPKVTDCTNLKLPVNLKIAYQEL